MFIISFIMVILMFCLSPCHGFAKNENTAFFFRPYLVMDREPELCSEILNAGPKWYFTPRSGELWDNDEKYSRKNTKNIQWLNWNTDKRIQGLDGQYVPITVHWLKLDLENNGSWQYIMYIDENNYHLGYLAKSFEHLKSAWPETTEDNKYFTLYDPYSFKKIDLIKYYPVSLIGQYSKMEITYGGYLRLDYYPPETTFHQLFSWQRKFYFISEDLPGYEKISEIILPILRLRGDGKAEPVCLIQIAKPPHEARNVLSTPGLMSFLNVLMTITDPGTDWGSNRIAERHRSESIAKMLNVIFKERSSNGFDSSEFFPQNKDYDEYEEKNDNEVAMKLLTAWSTIDLWSQREFQTLQLHIQPAIQALAKVYQKRGGLPADAAQQAASDAIFSIIKQWVMVPGEFRERIAKYYPLNKYYEIPNYEPENEKYFTDREEEIMDSIEWIPLLKSELINKTNPNTTNKFGKTALMVAAHLNRPDAVKLLLEYGADPNLATPDHYEKYSADLQLNINITQRTALMYAAENASPMVMRLLIQAGANVDAMDSNGQSVYHYLERNPRLTEAEKMMDIRDLANSNFTPTLGFDCANPMEEIEKIICQDEALILFYDEMHTALARWEKYVKSEAIWDQQRWWVIHQKQCQSLDEKLYLRCLQQATRARVRYLHNRLGEHTQKNSNKVILEYNNYLKEILFK